MRTIHKFTLKVTDTQTVKMPEGARLLCVQTQHGGPKLWAEVDTSRPEVERTFEIFGTGHPMHVDMGVERRYLDTFQLDGGSLVFHAYERLGV